MCRFVAVFVGGGVGTALRFAVGSLALRFYTGLFPLGTFLINISGSFLIGALMTLLVHRPAVHPGWRLFLIVGVLGGYTTFSSFEWETFMALRSEAMLVAALNVLLSVALGLAGVWAGTVLARFGVNG